jgi:hypothetical protein
MATTKLNNGQLPTTLSSKTIDNSNDINTTTTRLKISGGSNGQVLSTDGASNLSWVTAGGGVSDGDKGDITVASSGTVWTIDNGVVTYAKLQDVSDTNRLLGRATAGSGDAEEITIGSGLSLSGTTLSALGAPIAIVRKTADETVTSSTTLQNDDHLTYTFPGGTIRNYYIFINILWYRTNVSAAVSPKVSGSGNFFGGTMRRYNSNQLILLDGSSELTGGNISLSLAGALGPYADPLTVLWRSDTAPTTFTFRWAQATSSTTGLRAGKGSYIEIYDLGEA